MADFEKFLQRNERYCCVHAYVNLDFKRVNDVEYACGISNFERNDTSSRTRDIQTVSRSCAYACAASNY